MTIKITTPNGGSDSLDFGCAQTAIVATVTGTEVSSGEGKLEFKTTTGGTSATKMSIDAAGLLKFNSGYGSAATAYGCRAWVNFNGTGTVAIREDGNVSSITDNGTGDYTVNFAVNMPDINYAWSGGAWNSGGTGRAYVYINNTVASALAVGSIRFRTGGTSDYDVATIALSVFR